MGGVEKHMAYQPMVTTTATTSWSGWKIMNSRCGRCVHFALASGIAVCYCMSRIVRHGAQGDECMSYREVGE